MSRVRANPAHKDAAGSLSSGEPAFLAVGKLRRAHGVHGEILMEVLTDFPERLTPGTTLFLGQDARPMHLEKSRRHNEGLLMTFEGYNTPEDIGQFRNQIVYVKTTDRPPLDEGEYYHHQLIGLRVLTQAGESIGRVSEILATGATDVLVVRPSAGPDVLIPIADAFILRIDLSVGEIIVHLIPGMRAEEV